MQPDSRARWLIRPPTHLHSGHHHPRVLRERRRREQSRKKVAECDDKLANYRQALEAGTDPTIVGEWTTAVKLARKAADIALRPKTSTGRLTSAEIKDLVGQLKGIVAILANAEPEDPKAVYSELNLAVVYHDDGRMQVSAGPDACTNKCVGAASRTLTPHANSGWIALPIAA